MSPHITGLAHVCVRVGVRVGVHNVYCWAIQADETVKLTYVGYTGCVCVCPPQTSVTLSHHRQRLTFAETQKGHHRGVLFEGGYRAVIVRLSCGYRVGGSGNLSIRSNPLQR